jgi:Domain of unknown function (DUF4129)
MIRAWDDFVGDISEWIPVPLAATALIVLALLIGVLLYTYPSWLPWRWWVRFVLAVWRGMCAIGRGLARAGRWIAAFPGRLRQSGWRGLRLRARWRFGRFSWPWRRRRPVPPAQAPEPVADDELPDRPSAELASLADWYAAQGRYAEAVRERLRGILRALVEASVITAPPGSTVVELTAAVGYALPVAHPPVHNACEVFSEIWYGQRPATAADDTRLRGDADQVGQVLASVRGALR